MSQQYIHSDRIGQGRAGQGRAGLQPTHTARQHSTAQHKGHIADFWNCSSAPSNSVAYNHQ